MVKLAHALGRLKSIKALVIGDLFLDSYTIGKAKRISPEAPVAVINVEREEHRPGGAGNVILNLLSLGAQVIAVGRKGNDWAGQTFTNALENEGVNTEAIVLQEGYSTPIKNRVIADNQQIVRVDHESVVLLEESVEQGIIDRLDSLLEGVSVIAISDYGKGFLTSTLLTALIQKAKERDILVITDPKGKDFSRYRGTTIIKPNLSEAYAAANLPMTAPLDQAAASVLSQCEAELLMVTRSEAGISLFHKEGCRSNFPVHAKEVKDVTGAGDTVLAVLAFALANHLSIDEAAQLCNVAAGIAIEHVGCARVSITDLAVRLFQYDMEHKIFDHEHLFVLQEILKDTSFILLTISNISAITPSLFRAVKEISAEKKSLLLYIEDSNPCDTLLEMLSSLHEVNYILFHPESLKALSDHATPEKVFRFDELTQKLEVGELDFSSAQFV